MVKLTVLYGTPTDTSAFEAYYATHHLPLVDAVPRLRRFEAALALPGPAGEAPPFYRIAELWFDSPEDLQASMATPEGQAPADDVATFATGGVTVFVSAID